MAPLAPFNPPLGVHPQFCYPVEETLQMKEKVFSLSGDDFTITTVSGEKICKCKGKVMSISDSKKFTDIRGNELFTLKNKHFAIHKSFHAEGPGGHDVFKVKGHFARKYLQIVMLGTTQTNECCDLPVQSSHPNRPSTSRMRPTARR